MSIHLRTRHGIPAYLREQLEEEMVQAVRSVLVHYALDKDVSELERFSVLLSDMQTVLAHDSGEALARHGGLCPANRRRLRLLLLRARFIQRPAGFAGYLFGAAVLLGFSNPDSSLLLKLLIVCSALLLTAYRLLRW